MEALTAQTAKELMNNSENFKLENVFLSISANAKRGANSIMVYEKLSQDSIDELKKRGFSIEELNGSEL